MLQLFCWWRIYSAKGNQPSQSIMFQFFPNGYPDCQQYFQMEDALLVVPQFFSVLLDMLFSDGVNGANPNLSHSTAHFSWSLRQPWGFSGITFSSSVSDVELAKHTQLQDWEVNCG